MKLMIVCILIVFSSIGFVQAQEIAKDDALAGAGWRELVFDGKNPNTFVQAMDKSIEVKSDKSVSVLYKKIDINLAETPKLSWAWKVEKSVPITNLSVKGKDDRALAVYVSFPFDEERAGFWERFIRAFVVAFKGEDTPGRVISYVWGGDVQTGTILESPYLKGAGAMIALQKAKFFGSSWQFETVDIAKDYERIFGMPANKPFQIAISADTDDTLVDSLGWIKNLRFE